MTPQSPPVIPPTGVNPASKPSAKRRPWLLYIGGGLLAFILVVITTAAVMVWWSQRPMKPVVLSEAERTALDQKLETLGNAPTESAPAAEADRVYVPGTNVVQLTEREINGLLNDNTDLGQTLRLEFGRDAINAYIAAPFPEDVPVVGGKMFRARGRFRLALSNDTAPIAMLEDVTVYGVSLPKAWLGGLKGENLISQAIGDRDGKPLFNGVKSLKVEPGVLRIELEQ